VVGFCGKGNEPYSDFFIFGLLERILTSQKVLRPTAYIEFHKNVQGNHARNLIPVFI
jgi:hypothetical protein